MVDLSESGMLMCDRVYSPGYSCEGSMGGLDSRLVQKWLGELDIAQRTQLQSLG